MAYLQQEKIPGGGHHQQQQHFGQFEEGIEPVVHQYGQYPEHYNAQQPPPTATAGAQPAAETTDASRTRGKKNSVIWILISILILLLLLVIGLGAGLGAKLNQANSRATSSAAQTTVTYIPSSISSSALPTATLTAASSTATPTIPCPSQNLTLYTATTSVKAQFRLYCGFDFSSDGAADLASVNTVSMEACMDACASADGCQGAGWGSTGGSSTSTYTCYMKTNLTTAHDAVDSWCFALNLNNTQSVTI